MVFAITLLLIIVVTAVIGTLWLLVVLFFTRVPFVKTPKENIKLIIDVGNIQKNDVVYDLGCGDAHVLIEIERSTGATTRGFELSPLAYVAALRNIRKANAKTKVEFKNFTKADISNATVIFLFLIPSVMSKTGALLKERTKPGTRVVSYGFAIPEWKPERVLVSAVNQSNIFLYRV